MHEKQEKAMDRRNFLRAFGGVSTAAAVTAVVASVAPDDAAAYNPGEEEMRSRYQESDHVKAFYRVNRYPNASQ